MHGRGLAGRLAVTAVVLFVATPLVGAVLPLGEASAAERAREAMGFLLLVGWWAWLPGGLAYAITLPQLSRGSRLRAVLASPLIAALPLLGLAGIALTGEPAADGPDRGGALVALVLVPAVAVGAVIPLPDGQR